MSDPLLLLAGYGNAPFERFAEALRPWQLDLVLDARLVPYGWEERYRGDRFLRELEGAGVTTRARWAEGLGNAAKRDGGPMRLAEPRLVRLLAARLDEGLRVAVVCGCREGDHCHRTLIGEMVAQMRPAIPVHELGAVAREGDLPPGPDAR